MSDKAGSALNNIFKDNLHRKALPPDPPCFLLMRIIKMLSEHQLMEILDKVCVEPEEERAVIIALRNSFGGAVEHELGILVHCWRVFQFHLKFVSFLSIFNITAC